MAVRTGIWVHSATGRRAPAARLALGLALLALLALSAPRDTLAAGCSPSADPYDFTCTTDASGMVTLTVPNGENLAALDPSFAPVEDCTWKKVLVDFGDGTSDELEWNATVGLTESHTYPIAGRDYAVAIDATEGTHNAGGAACEERKLSALVTYPAPAATGRPPPEPPSAGVGGADRRRKYWRVCGLALTHRIACNRARYVIRAALRKLRRAPIRRVRAKGFTCVAHRHRTRPLACRRGERRILARV